MLPGIKLYLDFKEDMLVARLLDQAEINSNHRIAAFLSQCHHESMGFSQTRENLNYSSKALLKVFPGRFNKETAELYGRTEKHKANEIMIGNIAYALRLGNGDIASGDGYKYRGGGYIQITGKDKYCRYGKLLDEDLEFVPDFVQFPKTAFKTALIFWTENRIAELNSNVSRITERVNGKAMLGLNERIRLFIRYSAELELGWQYE